MSWPWIVALFALAAVVGGGTPFFLRWLLGRWKP